MSSDNQDFTFINENECKSAIEEIRKGDSETNWVVFGYPKEEDNDYSVGLISKGAGGIDDVRDNFFDSSKVIYVILGASTNDGKYSMVKHVLVTWIGEKVAPLHRARSATGRTYLYEIADKLIQMHCEIQALSQSEISDELIAQKLAGSKLEQAGDSGASKSRVDGGGSGMTAFKFADEAQVRSLIEAIRSRSDKTNYVLLGYKNTDDSDVSVLNHGEGGLETIQPQLTSDSVSYFVLGIQPENEKVAGGDFTQTKHMLVSWVGPSSEPMQKAKSSQTRVQIYNFVKQIMQLHGEYQALNESELTEQLLKEKLTLSKSRDEDALRAAAKADVEKEKARARARQPDYKSSGTFTGFAGTSAGTNTSPFKPEKEEEAVAVIKEVGRDDSDVNWVLFDYESNKVNIKVHSKGSGALAEFKDELKPDQVMYALLGVAVDEGDYSTIKYTLVRSLGKVAPLHRARSAAHTRTLYNFIGQYVTLAGEYHRHNNEEITTELILKKLAGSSLETAGNTSSATSNANRVRSARGSGFKTSSSQYTFEEEDKIVQVLKAIQDKGNSTNWVLLGHTEGNRSNTIGMLANGEGSLDEMKPHFKDEDISYGIMCVVLKEHDDESGNYATRKYIFISWVGPKVKPLAKARSSQHRIALYNWAKKTVQMHGILQAMQIEEITMEKVEERITGSRN